MGLADRISSVTAFFRAGYAKGAPLPDMCAFSAIAATSNRRRDHRDRSKLIARGRRLTADIGVEITRITDEMPSLDDLARVQHRIAAIRRPDESSERPTQ